MNNYCRNCGHKLNKETNVCPNCQTKGIERRVRTDDGYLKYILINLVLIAAGFIFGDYRLPFYVAAVIVLISAKEKYRNRPIISILLYIEVGVMIAILLFIFAVIVSCYATCIGR